MHLFICRELREKIQPEIMELIKQQRLNRLCEGTCFRKISSRRRQGETHTVLTRIYVQAFEPDPTPSSPTHHNHGDTGVTSLSAVSTSIRVLFPSPSPSICLFCIPPLCTRHSSPYSLCYIKTPQEIFEAMDCSRFCCHDHSCKFSASLSL